MLPAQRIMTRRSTTAVLLGAWLTLLVGVAWGARSESVEVKDRTGRLERELSLGPDDGECWSGLVVRHVLTRSTRDSAGLGLRK